MPLPVFHMKTYSNYPFPFWEKVVGMGAVSPSPVFPGQAGIQGLL